MQVIDALIVSLGLDTKDFVKGAQAGKKSEADLAASTIKVGKAVSDAKKRAAAEDARRAKDLDARAKAIGQGVKKLRDDALAFAAVLTGGIGLVSFIKNTVNTASSLGRLSDNLGISTERLDAWQQAAQRAGGSSEGMLAQLRESASEVSKFQLGQDSASNSAFFRYGGKDSDLKKGAEAFLKARADIIKREYAKNPLIAQNIAREMGISDDTFNLLKQGADEVEKLVTAREKYSKFSRADAEQADKLKQSMLDLNSSFSQVTTGILVSMMPAFDEMAGELKKFGKLVNDHKDDISSWALVAVKSVASVAKVFGSLMAETTDRLSDPEAWERLFKGVSIQKSKTPTAVDPVPDSDKIAGLWGMLKSMKFGKSEESKKQDAAVSVNTPASAKDVISKLRAKGWTTEQAAGIAGSLAQESRLNPGEVNPKSGAYGVAQWLDKSRIANFKKVMGKDLVGSSLDDQLNFMDWELKNTYKAAGDKLRKTTTSGEASAVHSDMYEQAGSAEKNNARRAALAASILAAEQARNAAGAARLPSAAGAVGAAGVPANNSTSSNETHISKIEIKTAATDAAGIARDIGEQLRRVTFASQMNTGLA